MSQREQIRSYAALFQKQWRVHTIPDGKGGKIRLGRNGISMRTVGYFLSVVVVMVVLCALPMIGWVLAPLTFVMKYVAIPAGGAVLLTQLEPDGRSSALWLWSMARHYATPNCRSAGRRLRAPGSAWLVDDPVVVAASPQGTGVPRGVLRAQGAGTVTFAEEMVVLPERGGRWLPRRLRRAPVACPVTARLGARARARAHVVTLDEHIELDPGDRLRVRP